LNFTDINTVGELVLANETELSPEEKAVMWLAKCGPETHLKMAKVMVEALRDYHVEQAREMAAEGDAPVAWVVDATRLDAALAQLNHVKL